MAVHMAKGARISAAVTLLAIVLTANAASFPTISIPTDCGTDCSGLTAASGADRVLSGPCTRCLLRHPGTINSWRPELGLMLGPLQRLPLAELGMNNTVRASSKNCPPPPLPDR